VLARSPAVDDADPEFLHKSPTTEVTEVTQRTLLFWFLAYM
jgi:hypothetical protein